MKEGYEKWLIKNKLQERFDVNRVLIDFKLIPQTIKARVLGEYDGYRLPDPSKMYEFFSKNKFKSYIDNFSNVEGKLYKLY